jgi:hypothetical protein
MSDFSTHQAAGTAELSTCIQQCQDCQRACLETAAHCLGLGGRHAEPEHIRVLLACAEICRTSAAFMMLGSDLHAETCGVCATVCERCAESCAEPPSDSMMQQCAEACRACVQSCRSMAHSST